MIANFPIQKDFFSKYRIIYISGDDNMTLKYKKEFNNMTTNYVKISVNDAKYMGFEEKPFYYHIIKDFYIFIINEITSLENYIKEFDGEIDKEHLFLRCADFKKTFNFDSFYCDHIEDLMLSLNEDSRAKLYEIIDLMKKEYIIFKRMAPDFYIFNEMIDWIEDAFFVLRKHIENLTLSQKTDYKPGPFPQYNNNYTAEFKDHLKIPYAA